MSFVSIHPDLQGHTKAIKESKAQRKAKDAALCILAQKGNRKAQGEMVKRYGRLAVAVAKHYLGSGEPIQDLVIEAMRGLSRGVMDFDHTLGYDFTTHGLHWARAYVARYVTNSGSIRYPSNKRLKAMRAKRAGEVTQESEEFDRLKTVSIDAPVSGDKGDILLKDMLEAEDRTDSVTVSRQLREKIEKALAHLTAREKQIITLRYGLTTGEPATLEDCGVIFGFGKERARQIQDTALARLRRIATKSGEFG